MKPAVRTPQPGVQRFRSMSRVTLTVFISGPDADLIAGSLKQVADRINAERPPNRVVVTPKQETSSPAERATLDYKRVREQLDELDDITIGSRMTDEARLTTALHRAGVTRARWREIMKNFDEEAS